MAQHLVTFHLDDPALGATCAAASRACADRHAVDRSGARVGRGDRSTVRRAGTLRALRGAHHPRRGAPPQHAAPLGGRCRGRLYAGVPIRGRRRCVGHCAAAGKDRAAADHRSSCGRSRSPDRLRRPIDADHPARVASRSRRPRWTIRPTTGAASSRRCASKLASKKWTCRCRCCVASVRSCAMPNGT